MLNANELRAAIVRRGYTQKRLAEEIGMSEPSLYRKIKNGTFGLNEANKIIEVLKIDKPEEIFFAKEVT
jgi:transcriptional regulator with XRE-family HTH domain